MAQHPPPPPITVYPRGNPSDLYGSEDEIIDVFSGSEFESELEPEFVSKTKRAKNAQPTTLLPSASPIETKHECWRLTKAPAKGKNPPNWERVERAQLSLPSDELAQQAKKHRKTKSVTDSYKDLSADQRQQVELLIKEKKRDEVNPNAEWELADIQRERRGNYKTGVRETTFIHVILKRQDKRKDAILKKPIEKIAEPSNIVDLNDRTRILSLESDLSKKVPKSQISLKDKSSKKHEGSKKPPVVVDGGKASAYRSMGSGNKNLPPLGQTAQHIDDKTQSSRQVPRYPTTGGQSFHFPSLSMAQQAQEHRMPSQTQPQGPTQAHFTHEHWVQQQAQSATRPPTHPQRPGMQHPTQSDFQFPAEPATFGMQQPEQSKPTHQTLSQQPEAQQVPTNRQQQTPLQQNGQQQQVPMNFQRPAQAQQTGAQNPVQPTFQQRTTGQGFFDETHQNPQPAGAQQQPQPHSSQQQNQTTVQFPRYMGLNGQAPQPRPQPVNQSQSQPQPQPTQSSQPRVFQSMPEGHQVSSMLPTGLNMNPGQFPRGGVGGRTGVHAEPLSGRFSANNLRGSGQSNPMDAPMKDPRFPSMNSERPGFQRGVSDGHVPNYALPRMDQRERANLEHVLRWQQTHPGHSRSSSSFDERSSTNPSGTTPQTSVSGGYPADRRYPKQSAGYQFPSDHSSEYINGKGEKVNIFPARSGRRHVEEQPVRAVHNTKQERPMIFHEGRRDRSVSRSPARRSEKKKSKKKSSRKDSSSSESSESEDERYERSSKRSSKRSGKSKKTRRKEEYSSESSESSDSEDGHYILSSRSRGRKKKTGGSRKTRDRSQSPKRRSDWPGGYDSRQYQQAEGPSTVPWRGHPRTDSEAALAVDVLNRRVQEMERKQAEETERKRRDIERNEAYEKGLQDAIAWKKSGSSGFPGL